MSDTTLRQLEYVVAVADHRHFGRAAHALHVSQPGLSAQVRELERRLGVQLFERSSRRVQLTSAGRDLVERARHVVSAVGELEASARLHHGTVAGPLAVAAIPTMAPYLLPALAARLRAEWPHATLQIHEMTTAALVEAIDGGEVDLGLLALPVDTGPLHTEVVGHESFVLALPEQHHLARRDTVALAALKDLPVLVLEDGHCLRQHTLDACAVAGGVAHHEIRSASLTTLTQMVAGGVGVTLLPQSAVAIEARPGNGITTRRFRRPAPGRDIALAWRGTDPRGPRYAELATAMRAAPLA